MKVILKRDEFNELNKEYEVHHIEQDKYGNKKIYLNKHRWVAPSLIEKYIEGENMKTIKIIDLLNKIANGEEVPKKIKYNDEIWEYYKDLGDYIRAGKPNTLFTMYYIHKILNNEVEIIEEDKKIEQIYTLNNESDEFRVLANKINELIDEVNKLKEKYK